MSNYTNSRVGFVENEINTFPDSYQTLAGTISSVGVFVTGTGTAFLTQIGGESELENPNLVLGRGWLLSIDTADLELRRIVDVMDDTHLVLEQAFTTNLAADAVLYVPPSRAMYIKINLPAGDSVNDIENVMGRTIVMEFGSKSEANVCADPVIIDATGSYVVATAFFFN